MSTSIRIVLLGAVLIGGCTNAEKATQVLQAQGYREVTITGYKWLGCAKDDAYHTGFRAKAPSGQRVDGTVCAGLWVKGSTIRLD